MAAWIARCKSPSVVSLGTRSRRQTGGFVSRSVTFRLTTFRLTSLVVLAVLAITASCHPAPHRLRAACLSCARWGHGEQAGSCSSRQGLSIEGEAEGMEDADATSSGGFEDRADVGVEVGAPRGSEAVGDLAEDDAGPQGLFGPVVGGRRLAVSEEDEQALAEALDDALELQPRLVVRHDLEQVVERALEPGVVGGQGGVGERRTTVADAHSALEQMLHAGGEGSIAGVDRVLDVAQQMGEADLMVPGGPAHLGAEAVGDPDRRADIAEELAHRRLAARWADEKAGAA